MTGPMPDGPGLDDLLLRHVDPEQRTVLEAALARGELEESELISAFSAIDTLNSGEYLGNIRPVLESTLTSMGLVDDGGYWLSPQTRNEFTGMTVAEILATGWCRCGHEFQCHFPDGLLGEPGGCEWVWGDRSCLCGGFVGPAPDEPDDVPADMPNWWETRGH